jgi:FtsZ-binding cell division protein ZapB
MMKKSKLSKKANRYLHLFKKIQMGEEELKKEHKKMRGESKALRKKWANLEKRETKLVEKMVKDIV